MNFCLSGRFEKLPDKENDFSNFSLFKRKVSKEVNDLAQVDRATVNCPAQRGVVSGNAVCLKRLWQHPKLKNFEASVTAPNLQI